MEIGSFLVGATAGAALTTILCTAGAMIWERRLTRKKQQQPLIGVVLPPEGHGK